MKGRFLIGYFLYLHFKCFPLSEGLPFRNSLSHPPPPCLYEGALPLTHPLLSSCPGISLHWGIKHPQGPRATPPIDGQLGHPLLHMQLEPRVPLCAFFDWWFSPREL